MKVILDLDKISYGTLSMIGQDYGIKDTFEANEEGIKDYVNEVVEILNDGTEKFKEELYVSIVNALESIKIDFSTKL